MSTANYSRTLARDLPNEKLGAEYLRVCKALDDCENYKPALAAFLRPMLEKRHGECELEMVRRGLIKRESVVRLVHSV